MNFSTTPPYRSITVRASSKYRLSSSRTSSGSRDSDSDVNPTTSQNSTEHTRRSAIGASSGSAPGATAGPTWRRAVPEPYRRAQSRMPGKNADQG
jgi:hypothetical protein